MVIEESLADWLSSTDAAARLGLTPGRVRELIALGTLGARRVGGRFLVSRADVEARATAGVATGRPFSPRRAWGLILLAAGRSVPELDPVTRAKLRRVLREQDLWTIRRHLGTRSRRVALRAHPSDLPRLEAEPEVVRTGPRHAASAGLGLIAPEAPVELYVDPPSAERLIAHYRLRPADRPNVVLRVVPAEVRSWIDGPIAPPPAIALDLADDPDPRSQAAARNVLARR
jgi:excisionase family DNA binding protein